MAQELVAQATALVGTLDKAGNVRHSERLELGVGHNAHIGHQGGEGVVGNFGTRRAEHAEQGGLAGIGEAHQTHIRQDLQLQLNLHFPARAAGSGIARRLLGGGLEAGVALAAMAAIKQHLALVRQGQIQQQLARGGIAHLGARRNLDHHILAATPTAQGAGTRTAILGLEEPAPLEVQQIHAAGVHFHHDVAAAPPVAAVGPTLGQILGMVQADATVSALATADSDADMIDEHGLSRQSSDRVFNKGAPDRGPGAPGRTGRAAYLVSSILRVSVRPAASSV